MKRIFCVLASVAMVISSGCSRYRGSQESPPGDAASLVLALTNAALIDLRTGQVRSGMTVIIEGERITTIGRDVRIPVRARTVDASSKYLIPGLTDTHVHLFSEWDQLPIDTAAYFGWILAGGVTSIREMSAGDGSVALAARAATRAGGWPGPRIYVSAGPSRRLAEPWLPLFQRAGVNDVAATLRSFRALGIDGLKLSYNAPRDSVLALIAKARAANVPVFGHTVQSSADRPPSYDYFTMDAVRAGLAGVVHGVVRPAGPDTIERPTLARDTPAGRHAWMLHQFTAWRRVKDRDLQALVDTMVARRVWYEPTVMLDYYWNHQSEYDTTGLPPHHPWRLREWYVSTDTQIRRAVAESYAAQFRFIKRFHDAGGMVLAGTDDVPFPPYGVSGELCLFVEAGLSPLAALRTATINAARAMGWADSLGSVEVGKFADIVILDGNPLENIANVRRIDAVIINGRLLDRATLDEYLKRVGTRLDVARLPPRAAFCR